MNEQLPPGFVFMTDWGISAQLALLVKVQQFIPNTTVVQIATKNEPSVMTLGCGSCTGAETCCIPYVTFLLVLINLFNLSSPPPPPCLGYCSRVASCCQSLDQLPCHLAFPTCCLAAEGAHKDTSKHQCSVSASARISSDVSFPLQGQAQEKQVM